MQLTTLDTNRNTSVSFNQSLIDSEIEKQLKWRATKLEELTNMRDFLQSNTGTIQTYLLDRQSSLSFADDVILGRRLDKECWSEVIGKSGVRHLMTEMQRQKMEEELSSNPLPFTAEAAKKQLTYYTDNAHKLFAERVEGIFNQLSAEHVTNRPGRFSEKLIFGGIQRFSLYNSRSVAAIHDLRCVIALLHGEVREIERHETEAIINQALTNTGTDVLIDGNALSLKIFKKGTCHLVVATSIADQLNDTLSFLYPLSLSDASEAKKIKNASAAKLQKKFVMRTELLPADLREALSMTKVERYYDLKKSDRFDREYERVETDKFEMKISDKDVSVVESLLGELAVDIVKYSGSSTFIFDFDVSDLRREIVANGLAPLDKVDSQFYQTTDLLRQVFSDEIENYDLANMRCLEPSAGFGQLATMLPLNSTVIDVSSFNIDVLRSKGFCNAKKADFLDWSSTESSLYDLIVMNPPWSGNRSNLHLEAALGLLADEGTCLALLPSTVLNKIDAICSKHEVDYQTIWKGTEKFSGTGELGCVVISCTKRSQNQPESNQAMDTILSFL
ncbi:DUF4942 domain-containing protein [Vibrio agarivorans]|uniref:DUF4942 domain-containing protein n=1 Tax=Vibrio agarivorans TaxID=153622 RepID=A0ABT7Y761_9VIBR|nr:DUF4942 domain-containing protein [Vibrio agarivorans]MDN2483840.1 DUF4942 domain-containing protein [Vibrio agarivorans]